MITNHLPQRQSRVEYKYLITFKRFLMLKDLLASLFDKDPHHQQDGYPVHSVYYDTQGYDYFHEKIQGEFFHRKARLRTYGLEPFDGPSFFEIKYKYNETGYKERFAIPSRVSLLDLGHQMQIHDSQCLEILGSSPIFPVCSVFYKRQAYSLQSPDGVLRVNLDSEIACGFESNHQDGYDLLFPEGSAVLELKAPDRHHLESVASLLKLAHKGRTTFSKYISCMNVFYTHYLVETPNEF